MPGRMHQPGQFAGGHTGHHLSTLLGIMLPGQEVSHVHDFAK